MGGDFEHAALGLYTVGFTGDDDRHADLEFLVRLDLLEVDVEVGVGDRVTLDFLQEGEGHVLFVFAGELNDLGATGDGFEEADKLGYIDREFFRVGVHPVDNCGNALNLAQAARGRTARLSTGSDGEREFLCHSFVPPIPPGIGSRRSRKGAGDRSP